MKSKQPTDKLISYKEFSNSVLKTLDLTSRTLKKNVSKAILNNEKKPNYRFDNGLYLGVNVDTTKKKFKEATPSYGNWEKFMLNNLRQERVNSSIQIVKQRLIENSNTHRTMVASTDKNISQRSPVIKHDISYSNLRTSATGSISNLLAVTPLNEVPKKQSRVSECTEIFKPQQDEIKGKKRNMIKNASFSGNLPRDNEDLKSSISKQKRLSNLESRIFEKPQKLNLNIGQNKKNEQSTLQITEKKKVKKYLNHSNIMF